MELHVLQKLFDAKSDKLCINFDSVKWLPSAIPKLFVAIVCADISQNVILFENEEYQFFPVIENRYARLTELT